MLSFPKAYRLTHKRLIDQLFREGKHIKYKSFRLIFLQTNPKPTRVLISVPRRNFPKAVHRNRIKRQIREIYRINLLPAINSEDYPSYLLAIIYISRLQIPFDEMSQQLQEVFRRFHDKSE